MRTDFLLVTALTVLTSGYWPAQAQQRPQGVIQRASGPGASAPTFSGTLTDSAGAVSCPIGRVAEKSGGTRWVTEVSALPWLILADASHRVVAEGFSLDELDAPLQHLGK